MNGFRKMLSLATAMAVMAMMMSAHAVTIDWVTVGDPGNVADTSDYGAVGEEFRIGTYEVTIGQYAEFLNAAAASDPYALWDELMETQTSIAGIARTGSDGSYEYTVIGPSGTAPAGASSPGNRPITFVSWFDAARFANWMHNGQGSGDTETGAYTLDGVTSGSAAPRNPGARVYIPTQDQWYKAAYYKGGGTNAGYWAYATQSDTVPGNVIGSSANQANYRTANDFFSVTQSAVDEWQSSDQNYLTDVGAFTNSPGAYGTFDMSGNVNEWTDSFFEDDLASRYVRGGMWLNGASGVSSSYIVVSDVAWENVDTGFRLAAPVPEPSTYALALAGLACGGWHLRRRRRA